MNVRPDRVLFAILVCFSVPERGAEACMCIGHTPACQAVWLADAVFVGRVVATEAIEPAVVDPDGPWTPAQSDRQRVRLEVIERFRGVLPSSVDVHTGAGDLDCGYRFGRPREPTATDPGARYLVYASRGDDGILRTSICHRTQAFEWAGNDLEYLRRLDQIASSSGTIQGTARLVLEDRSDRERPPFPGLRVIALSGAARVETMTGTDGSYTLSVPVGAYSLHFEAPEGFLAAVDVSPHDVEIRDVRGCAQAEIRVRSNGRVAGRLLTARGETAADVAVHLHRHPQPVASPLPRLSLAASIRTEADGTFEFSALPAGTYYLSTLSAAPDDNRRRPAVLQPGTTDPEVATAITVATGAATAMGDVVLPESHVLVRGVVRSADGRPLGAVPVLLLAPDSWQTFQGTYESRMLTGPDGHFQFLAISGVRYRFATGEWLLPGEDLHRPAGAPPLRRVEFPEFEAVADLSPVNIVVPD